VWAGVADVSELRPLRTGWRALVYRGRHRQRGGVGRIAGGVLLFTIDYLQ